MTTKKKPASTTSESVAKAKATVVYKTAVKPPAPRVITSIVLPIAEAVAAVYAKPKIPAMKPEESAKARRMVELAEKAGIAAGKPDDCPITKELAKGGFTYIKSQAAGKAVAHGYVHQDGRAVLYTVTADGSESWTMKTPDGAVGGTNALTLGVSLENAAVAMATRPPAPANVLRAIEMLGEVTKKTYKLGMLKGDKYYGARVAMLKKLYSIDKVLVEDSGLGKLTAAFHSAVGAHGKSVAALEADFEFRCADLTIKARAAVLAAKKYDKAALAKVKSATILERMAPGDIKPWPKKLSRAAQALQDEVEREAVIEECALAVTMTPIARPHPDADIPKIVCGDVGLLRVPENGIVMLQMEKENSQGAICVYNNGNRVAVGVVPLEILKTLRPVQGVDLVQAAEQLLNPTVPSVPVTPAAARHLNSIINCKEFNTMAIGKKPIKKFEAPKATTKPVTAKPAKAVTKKEAKEPTERKASGYRLLNAAKTVWSAYKGQKADIVAALVKLGAVGAKAPGATSAQLQNALPNVGHKNIAFYLSTLQKTDPAVLEKLAPAE